MRCAAAAKPWQLLCHPHTCCTCRARLLGLPGPGRGRHSSHGRLHAGRQLCQRVWHAGDRPQQCPAAPQRPAAERARSARPEPAAWPANRCGLDRRWTETSASVICVTLQCRAELCRVCDRDFSTFAPDTETCQSRPCKPWLVASLSAVRWLRPEEDLSRSQQALGAQEAVCKHA